MWLYHFVHIRGIELFINKTICAHVIQNKTFNKKYLEQLIMDIKKPIFINGAGRSGSSIFHKILIKHPNVAWLSDFCKKYPDKPSMNRHLMNAIDFPLIGKHLERKFSPSECYELWEYHSKGFRRPFRDLVPEDVTIKTKKNIHHIMAKIITNKRNRLLIKITGWPRIGFLSEIFKDAKFIHMIRDGRAVANSFINVGFWWGWQGPGNWRWGELTESQKEEWERYNKSFIVLSAIGWKILINALENAKKYISTNNFLEVKYEELCSNPLSVFKSVIEFCELEWSKDFEESVKKINLKNTNYKWQNELNYAQKNILKDVLKDYLQRYDYM